MIGTQWDAQDAGEYDGQDGCVAGTKSMRVELTWPNKDKFLLSPKDETGKPAWADRSHPAANEVRLVDWTGTCGQVGSDARKVSDNLLFTGDSLDVLRVLAEHPEFRREYRSKVKCVYIDPPFNTGQAFEHYDDWMEHSTWLSFMRDRLLLIKDLLAEDGSVWVHLDDVEQHRMRCLLDEVFGASNFIATVVWKKADSPRNSARYLSVDQDYIHVYAKNAQVWRPNRLARTAVTDAAYSNPDNDPRGPWTQGDPFANKPYSLGLYEVTGPTGNTFGPPPGRYWRVSKERFEELDRNGQIFWRGGGEARPRIKRYLNEVGDLVPRTAWDYTEVGSNGTSSRELRKLFPKVAVFATPKPEGLLQRVLTIASQPGDTVLDCFAGSGTTAAVAHKMRRRWVTSEILPDTVGTFTGPRLGKVIEGTDPGGITDSSGWLGGGGFRCLAVGPSMYEMADNGMPLLADWATNGRFSSVVAAQLDFDFQDGEAPFCGHRGRMRLAVLDGAVGPEEVRMLVAALGDDELVTVVAKVVLPGAEEMLGVLSKGSRIRKAPRDVLADGDRRTRRRETAR